MCAKSPSTPGEFYDISESGFGTPSLVLPEFRTGGWLSSASPNGDSDYNGEGFEILEHDESDRANIGSAKTVHDLN